MHSILDDQLLEGLRLTRGRGRNDYPVHVLWGVVLLTIARHRMAHLGSIQQALATGP